MDNHIDKNKILLVEDDPNLGFVTQESLESQGYSVTLIDNGDFTLCDLNEFDLCLIDIMLPKKDGFTLAREIRQINPKMPIIFLTAKSLKEDRIQGFKLGCDDYITKPFSMEELVLRMKAVLRRSYPSINDKDTQTFHIGNFIFDYGKNLLLFEKNEQKLTHKESELLRLLCLHLNQMLERDVALKLVWGDNSFFMGRSMDVYITKLRKYLKQDDRIQINTIHGRGFKMIVQQDNN